MTSPSRVTVQSSGAGMAAKRLPDVRTFMNQSQQTPRFWKHPHVNNFGRALSVRRRR